LKSPWKKGYNLWRKLTIMKVVVTQSCGVQIARVTINHAQFGTPVARRSYGID
jgi:hypothetical protein